MHLKRCLTLALLHCITLTSAGAQTADPSEVLIRAEAMSVAGEFAAVVALLETFVDEEPGRPEAWLLLAQHYYWTDNIAGARRTYTLSLEHFPAHQDIRLAYARFLLEINDVDQAKDVLGALPSDLVEANVIRGTIAWWAGDLTTAVRHFRSALDVDPTHAEASSGLSSILGEARPWVYAVGRAAADNQPLTHAGVSTEAGVFLTPLQSLHAELSYTRYRFAETATPMSTASAGYRSYWPAAKLETDLTAGMISRMDGVFWTGHLDAGYRAPFGMRLGARWERAPYLHTTASISESILTSVIQVSLSADRAGWLGKVNLQRERFPDENAKDVVYGWIMAPLIRTNVLTLQAGYAYGYQNTAESRFTPIISSAPRPGTPATWEGRYIPYYTPLDVRTHSLTSGITVRPIPALSVRAKGSYGFSGSEEAPYVYLVGRAPTNGVYEHEIRPWSVGASIEAAISTSITVQTEVSQMSTTWYMASTFLLSLYARI